MDTKKDPICAVYKRPNSKQGTHTVKGWKKIAHRQIANSKFIDSYADILYQLSHQGSPNSSVGKESACNSGGPGLIPGLGRSPGEGIGYPLQYSGLENAMDCIVHGVTKSQARPSHFHFHMWILLK